MEFETIKLGDLYNVASGLSKSAKEFGNGGYPFLSFKTIFYNYFLPDELPDLANTTGIEQEKCSILKGDVFLTRTSETANELGMSSVALKDYRCGTFNGFSKRLRMKQNCGYKVYPKYMGYFLRSTKFRNQINSMSIASTRASLNIEMINRLTVDLPDIECQKKIGDFLYLIDEKIKNNEAINRNLEEQILTKYRSRFLTFEHFTDELIEGEMGSQPYGWKVLPLNEVTENIRNRVKDEVDNVKVLSAVNTGKLVLSEDYFTKQVFSKDISKYILVEENDFAYNPARVNIGSIGINDLGIRGCVSPVYVVVRIEKEYEDFLRYFLTTDRFKSEVITRASGSVRQSMKYVDFGLINVVYPPIEVVKEFNELISPLQIAIKHNGVQNSNLKELRDALLPKLMSGELDVSDLDI